MVHLGKRSSVSLVATTDGILEPSLGRFGNAGIVSSGELLTFNTTEYHSAGEESSLLDVLETQVPLQYYLTPLACEGILRRAERRGKKLPETLEIALLSVIQKGQLEP
jgi:hypothetical protein